MRPISRFREGRAAEIVRRSGIFDAGFYRAMYDDVGRGTIDPLGHYVRHGAAEGRWPNPLFDPGYYAERYPGLRPDGGGLLLDFIRNAVRGPRSPHPWFDTDFYLGQAPEVARSGTNPLVHYLSVGARAGLDPHPDFSTSWYLASDPAVAAAGINPLVHFVRWGIADGHRPAAPIPAPPTAGPIGRDGVLIGERRVKLVAFYLPQFHPIPENDAWWGPGFTEWSKVVRAKPLYDGHRQPRLPTDLGFYDLRLPETRRAQADLAARFAIHGFCYYYYWFDGRRILERPLNEVLASGEPDFPFCIAWANENWTRRWDGLDHDVLLEQTYPPGWEGRFIQDVMPILADRRYIRFDGKPVLIVYRVRTIPRITETLEAWRAACREAGLGEIHIVGVRFWDIVDVREYGFDAALDFPPHHVAVRDVAAELPGLTEDFDGLAYDYPHLVRRNLETRGHGYEMPAHRGVMLAWDNTPRRGASAHFAHGATPEHYREWLEGVIEQEMESNAAPESLVFINAWNEWAEGASLEPDDQFGYAFLEATRDAVEALERRWRSGVRQEASVAVRGG